MVRHAGRDGSTHGKHGGGGRGVGEGAQTMTVKEYLVQNPNKASYTIKYGKKQYLCNIFEANSFFGDRSVKRVSPKYGNENLPLVTIV